MRVVFSRNARLDLANISDHIAVDNPGRADSFTRELLKACKALSVSPERLAVVPRYRSAGMRRTVHRGYLNFFRVSQGEVEIVRVLHGKRNIDALLGQVADR